MGKLNRFEARFNYGARQPDEFNSELGVAPDNFFVVAYDREGQPISKYGDDVWDLSAYQKNKPVTKLNFMSWIKGKPTEAHIVIASEIKWLIFLYWYFRTTINSVNTLACTLSTLRNLANHCAEHATSPINLLNDPIEFSTYLYQTTGSHAKIISALITVLVNMGDTKRGFPLLLGTSLEELYNLARVENTKNNQHPVIPTRIYSELFIRAIDELDDFESIADPFLQLVKDYSSYLQLGKDRKQLKDSFEKNTGPSVLAPFLTQRPKHSELIDQYGLLDYIETHSQRTGKEFKSIRNFSSHLLGKQSICFLLITLFSGMRRGETNRLSYDCLETYYENGRKHYRLCGETFKFSEGIATKTRWVTDPIVVKAVHVAQKIADIIYSIIGLSLNTEQRTSSDYPLFIGIGYLPFSAKMSRMTKKAPYSNSKGLGTIETLPSLTAMESEAKAVSPR